MNSEMVHWLITVHPNLVSGKMRFYHCNLEYEGGHGRGELSPPDFGVRRMLLVPLYLKENRDNYLLFRDAHLNIELVDLL